MVVTEDFDTVKVLTLLSKVFICFLSPFVSIQVSDIYVEVLPIIVFLLSTYIHMIYF